MAIWMEYYLMHISWKTSRKREKMRQWHGPALISSVSEDFCLANRGWAAYAQKMCIFGLSSVLENSLIITQDLIN